MDDLFHPGDTVRCVIALEKFNQRVGDVCRVDHCQPALRPNFATIDGRVCQVRRFELVRRAS